MAAINFPANPVANQVFVVGAITYTYDGQKWIAMPTPVNFASLNSNITPSVDSVYDLGRENSRWRDLYLSGNSMYLGTTRITADSNSVNFVNGASAQTANIIVGQIQIGFGSNSIVLQTNDKGLISYKNGNVASIAGGGASVTLSNIAPVNPDPGNLWFDTDTGRLLIYYFDGTNSYWMVPLGGVGPPGDPGITIGNVIYPTGNTASTSGGEEITVQGSNFAANCLVYLDKTECMTSNVTATSLKFVTPALAAGNYHLFVYNPDGNSGVKPIGLKYV